MKEHARTGHGYQWPKSRNHGHQISVIRGPLTVGFSQISAVVVEHPRLFRNRGWHHETVDDLSQPWLITHRPVPGIKKIWKLVTGRQPRLQSFSHGYSCWPWRILSHTCIFTNMNAHRTTMYIRTHTNTLIPFSLA